MSSNSHRVSGALFSGWALSLLLGACHSVAPYTSHPAGQANDAATERDAPSDSAAPRPDVLPDLPPDQCVPACDGKLCNASNGCGGLCLGCAEWEFCDLDAGTCYCPESDGGHVKRVGDECKPSCGQYLTSRGWKTTYMDCCSTGCTALGGSWLDETYDCAYCCFPPDAGASCGQTLPGGSPDSG